MSRYEEAIWEIRKAYARRTRTYDPLSPAVYLARQERERALIRWLGETRLGPPHSLRLLEVGCGTGGNLQDFIRLGFDPKNLSGNDLLEERVAAARRALPSEVHVIAGDCSSLELQDSSFDIVFQSMMCSSILDSALLQKVTERMWDLVRPGGGILWYDFAFNNPANRDVRGLGFRDVQRLFPTPVMASWRLTLAPPLARLVTRASPKMYSVFNSVPLLRTHLLCWIKKELH